MKKIAIFVEGISELIFIRDYISKSFNLNKVSFECWGFKGGNVFKRPYPNKITNAEIHFMIVEVGNDEKVLSKILDDEKNLFTKGFRKIIGIRDMYSKKYLEFSKGKIDEKISDEFIQFSNEAINEYSSNPKHVSIFFAKMEYEAWLLSMPSFLINIDSSLTNNEILNISGRDLGLISSDKILRPASLLKKILSKVGWNYKKSESDANRIASKIKSTDYLDATNNSSFENFHNFMQNL